MNNQACKLIIVDDHTLFRNGLRILLDTTDKYEVIAEASNGREFLSCLQQHNPDVVLLDIQMPEMDGIEAARLAVDAFPDIKILTLSMYGEEDYYYKMVDAGVKGFMLKNSDINELTTAIDTVYNGVNYFSPELLDNLVNNLKTKAVSEEKEQSLLSAREIEILIQICKGLSNQEIGDELFISKRTVDKHRANILEKSQCKNTAQLVVFAIKNRLVEI